MSDVDMRQYVLNVLAWEARYRELKALEDRIVADTLKLGASQSIGNVQVKFRKGYVTRNYEALCRRCEIPAEVIVRHSTVKTTVAWKDVLVELGVDLENAPADKIYAPTAKVELLA